MRKVLLLIGAALTSFSLSFAQAPQQEKLQKSDNATSLRVTQVELPKGFTYAERENAAAGKHGGVGTGRPGSYIAGAMELPVAAGVTIKGLSYFCESDDKYGKAFIAHRLASAPKGSWELLAVVQCETKKKAITKVDFPTPITTEANRVYIVGYEAKQTSSAGRMMSFVQDALPWEDASFMAIDRTKSLVGDVGKSITLEDYHKEGFGALAVVVNYDDPQGKWAHITTVNLSTLSSIRKIGNTIPAEEAKFSIPIRNLGGKEIRKVTLQTKKADGSSEEKEYPVKIAPESIGKVICEMGEISTPKEGSLEFVLKNVNGGSQLITAPALLKTSLDYKLYAEGSILRYKILVERFTTEKCGNCPPADKRLQAAYKTAEAKGIGVVVAAHHVGYYTDFLTLKQSEDILRYFVLPGKSVFAPAFSISRLNDPEIKKVIGDLEPGIYMGISSMEHISRQLELACQIPTEGRILKIDQKKTSDGVRSITVAGKLFDPNGKENLFLSIYRTEDGIPAQSQGGAGAGFKHDNAIREFVTPTFGEKVTVDEKGDFSITIENVKVSDDWDNDKMHFVVFIHRDIRDTDPKMRYAYAVEQIGIQTMVSTREVAPELRPVAYALEGRILINGAFDSFVVYDVAGRLVANNNDSILPAGLYIVKSRLGDVDYISKVIVK